VSSWLIIESDPVSVYYRAGDPVPDAGTDNVHARLLALGASESAVAVGGGAPVANQQIRIDNADGEATGLFSDPPLGLGARIETTNGIWWRGVIDRVDIGEEIALGLVQ